MKLRTSDLIGKTPEEKQVIIAAFIAARPKERTATMSEPTKLSEEERDDLASVHARLVELGPALYGDSVPYQQRLIEHIWATDDELAAQDEEIRRLTDRLAWHEEELNAITPTHEEFKAIIERQSQERQRLIEKCRTDYGHMTMTELVDAFRDCSWEEEGSIDFVMKEKAAQQDEEIRRLTEERKVALIAGVVLNEQHEADAAEIRRLREELNQARISMTLVRDCAFGTKLCEQCQSNLGSGIRRAAKAMEG